MWFYILVDRVIANSFLISVSGCVFFLCYPWCMRKAYGSCFVCECACLSVTVLAAAHLCLVYLLKTRYH